MKTTPKWKQPQNEDDPNKEDNSENKDSFTSEHDLRIEVWLVFFINATLGSNLDSESKLGSEDPEWDLKSHLTNYPPTQPPTRNMDCRLQL